jgi:diguanylate cyclase (GGDEF)-like protein
MGFFVAVLMLSSGLSFVGYHYLLLANAYRERNFHHLDEVYSALNLLRQRPAPTQEDLRTLISHVESANEQSVWCIENLGTLDLAVLLTFGARDALKICTEATRTGEEALVTLNRLADNKTAVTSRFIIYNEITRQLETMRDQSVTFEPYVTQIEIRLEQFVRTGTGVVSGVLILLSSFVARQLFRAQKKIEAQSITDPLTNLLNRRGLDASLGNRIAGKEPCILIRIDLDRFKQVNDVLGHEAGDFVLCHVADIMRNTCGDGDVLARVGGDEFVVLCSAGTTLEGAQSLAKTMLDTILEPVVYDGKQCLFGASFGISSTTPFDLSPSELLNAADKALYEVKRAGRGAVATYSGAMHEAAVRDRMLSDQMREALAAGEIVPYFQTQHHSDDGSLFGVEVLARWEHPTEGVMTPDQFLGVAQQMGLETEIDGAMFRQTVDFVDRLSRDGIDVPRVSFNVSAARITDPAFLTEVRDRIPVRRDRFAFEILESVSYEESSDVLTFSIDALKELGFQIDVDDFGSGHASINSVLNIWPDALKIDRNIIYPIVDNEQALRMTVSIVDLAKALNMQVIAEGVDSVEKVDLLRNIGCDVLQGFHFTKPMPARDLRGFLQQGAVPKIRAAS